MSSTAAPDVAAADAQHRRELVAYCYRMLGSAAEAEDAAQEVLVRAWRKDDSFAGRSSRRAWLYRIATNVCIDMQRAPQRRALPMDIGGPSSIGGTVDIGTPLAATRWIEPIHDSRVLPEHADPAEAAVLRESVRLAFVTALQRLPSRQRAVLVLRDVLAWSASEVAQLLDITVDAVTSALARARATLKGAPAAGRPLDDADTALLERYVHAFEAYDVGALVGLLHEDATFTMPPYAFWMRGRDTVGQWWDGPGRVCENSRVLLTRANGGPALAVYHPAVYHPADYRATGPSRWEPFAIHVLEVRGERIGGICHFLDTSLFAAFGLPAELHA